MHQHIYILWIAGTLLEIGPKGLGLIKNGLALQVEQTSLVPFVQPDFIIDLIGNLCDTMG